MPIAVKIYWTQSSIPELAGLSRAEQSRALRRVWIRTQLHPASVVLLVAGSFAFTAGIPLIYSGTESLLWTLIVVLPVGAALGHAYGLFLLARARPFLRRNRDEADADLE